MNDLQQLPNILVISSNEILIKKIKEKLFGKYFNCQITQANNIEMINKYYFDVVLLDTNNHCINSLDPINLICKNALNPNFSLLVISNTGNDFPVEGVINRNSMSFLTDGSNVTRLVRQIEMVLQYHAQEKALFCYKNQVKLIRHTMDFGCWEWNRYSKAWHCNHELFKLIGIPKKNSYSYFETIFPFIHDNDADRVRQVIEDGIKFCRGFDVQYRIIRPDGVEKHIYEHVEKMDSELNGYDGLFSILTDITQAKQAEDQGSHKTYIDDLTGLANRRLFLDRLAQAISLANRSEQLLATVCINFDRFKTINETFGLTGGDYLLKQVAVRLKQFVRLHDMVSRMGADEFVVLFEHIRTMDELDNLLDRLQIELCKSYSVHGLDVYLNVSMGVTVYPINTADNEVLLGNAERAMRSAKEYGGSQYRYYTHEMNTRAKERLFIENHLRRAIVQDHICVYFQPQYSTKTRELLGVEALARLRHPTRGMISPSEFIPVAEETGLIVSLGEIVLRTACQHAAQWIDMYGEPFRVAVNLSALQFLKEDIVEVIANILQETHLAARVLELEITESVAMKDVTASIKMMEALKGLGVKLSIDDFGTGYSSLSYLQRLPVNSLKIDRSFISRIQEHSAEKAITKAIIAMSHSLSLKVIAEGVETKQQLDYLSSLGCDEVQGFYLSRPVPAEDIDKLLIIAKRQQVG